MCLMMDFCAFAPDIVKAACFGGAAAYFAALRG